MTFREWLKKAEKFRDKNGDVLLPELLLNNGKSLSVQESRFHICTVGEDVEVFTHNVEYKELENCSKIVEGIYGHVSYDILEDICENSGGIHDYF